MEHVRELVPPKARQVIYAAYVVAGLVVGAVQAAGVAAVWVEPALNVLAYLAVPLAVLAGVNVPSTAAASEYDPKH